MKKCFLLFLAGLLVCGFVACANVTGIIAGDLKVELVRIERAGNVTQVAWRIRNPNVVSYLISKSSHKITLNGTFVGTLAEDLPLGVPAQNVVERTGVLVPAGPAAGPAIDQAMAQGSAAYKLESVVTILLLDDEYERLRFSTAGSVPVTAK